MKHLTIIALFITAMALSSCGINSAIVLNQNHNSTQVNLGSNNYKVVDNISASSSVKYICLIGGTKQKQLYQNTYAAMLAKANLTGGAKAVVNIVTEEHIGGVPPFYYVRTVTVSANVIEFIK